MFFIKNPTWITLWNVEPKEKYVDIRFTTSEKTEDGNYINSNWFGRFLGKAKVKGKELKKGDRIRMTSGKITAETYVNKDGEKKTAPTRVVIFDFDKGDGHPVDEKTEKTDTPTPEKKTKAKKVKASEKPSESSTDTEDDDYPF